MIDYIRHVGSEHRKSFGQFFTHPDVAVFMTDWVLASGKKSLFDPAFGLGVFRNAVPKNGNVHFSACEIDPKIVSFWENQTGENPEFITVGDYLRLWGERHWNIVCNPPYMRFQKFHNREIVFQDFQQHLGLRLSGYTNTASAFLLKSLSELHETGRMAYIMPLEFLNTGYGTLVKRKLLDSGRLAAILRFSCEKEIFPDATTSVGIILCGEASRNRSVRFYMLDSVADLLTFEQARPITETPLQQLDPRTKWLPLFQPEQVTVSRSQTTPLSTFGKFSRGIATGANEFFVLRPSGAHQHGVGRPSECIPCITRSSHIRKPVFSPEDYRKLQEKDQAVLLFSVDTRHSIEAERYIRFGQSEGFDQRFLTRHRTPWYKMERREPSPILMGVFSRGGYKVVLNQTQATNLTCFHGFQPNLFGRQYVEHLFLYLSSRVGRKIISQCMRQYGDALDKFEPNDLNDALAPAVEFLAAMPTDKVIEAVREIQTTGTLPAWTEDMFAPLSVSDFESESVGETYGQEVGC